VAFKEKGADILAERREYKLCQIGDEQNRKQVVHEKVLEKKTWDQDSRNQNPVQNQYKR
jgi:hypothetical protein